MHFWPPCLTLIVLHKEEQKHDLGTNPEVTLPIIHQSLHQLFPPFMWPDLHLLKIPLQIRSLLISHFLYLVVMHKAKGFMIECILRSHPLFQERWKTRCVKEIQIDLAVDTEMEVVEVVARDAQANRGCGV